MKRGLSQKSNAYLKDYKRTGKIKNKFTSSELIVFNEEIGEIFSTVISQSVIQIGNWHISCDQLENGQLHCAYTAYHKLDNLIHLKLVIDPMGTSYIQGGISDVCRLDVESSEAIASFKLSSAYKRYYQAVTGEPAVIRAIIPKKQISTRHLSAYLTHLVDHMNPWFEMLITERRLIICAA